MDNRSLRKIINSAYRGLKDRISVKCETVGLKMDITDMESSPLKADIKTRRQFLEWEEIYSNNDYYDILTVIEFTSRWFYRFVALRYMEVNGFLSSGIRVLSNAQGEFKPEILTKLDELDLPGLDPEMVKANRKNKKQLYRYLLLVQCRALHEIFPELFEEENDISELLLPDDLLSGGIGAALVKNIPDEEWKDPAILVQISAIYGSLERHDPKIDPWLARRISNPFICDMTQTPNWAVQYLAENAIGHKWLDTYPDDELQAKWRYYLEETQQDKQIRSTITSASDKMDALTSMTVFDPCAGAGRMLIHAFDVLMDIYQSCGVTPRDAARSILENNLFGLDTAPGMVQMARFALLMKARSYDVEILSTGIQPRIYEYTDANAKKLMDSMKINAYHRYMIDQNSCGFAACLGLRDSFSSIDGEDIDTFFDGINKYGPLFKIEEEAKVKDLRATIALLYERIDQVQTKGGYFPKLVQQYVLPIVRMLDLMTCQYDVVISEAPRVHVESLEGYHKELIKYIETQYFNFKSNTIDQILYFRILTHYVKPESVTGYISKSWTEVDLQEPVRYQIYTDTATYSLVELSHNNPAESLNDLLWVGRKVSDLQTTLQGYQSIHLQLQKFSAEEAFQYFHDKSYQTNILLGPSEGEEVLHDLLSRFSEAFQSTLGHAADMNFSENLPSYYFGKAVRYWFELDREQILTSEEDLLENASKWERKNLWAPYLESANGFFRKWYGNDYLVMTWLRDFGGYKLKHIMFNWYSIDYREAMNWKDSSTDSISFRYVPVVYRDFGYGTSYLTNEIGYKYIDDRFVNDEPEEHQNLMLATAFSNSCVASMLLDLWAKENEEARCSPDNVSRLPVGEPIGFGDDTEARETWRNTMIQHAETAIALSRADWDESELSWDYSGHPMVDLAQPQTIEDAYRKWQQACEERFFELKETEETINDLYIKNYQLEDMLTPTVEERDVSVYRIFDTTADIPESMAESDYIRTKRDAVVSLLSHAVGCLFGRYSLDEPGIVFAGGQFKKDRYTTIAAKADNVLVIHNQPTNDKNDLMNNFEHWLSCVYGEAHLEDSLQFIADALGGEGDARTIIRTYFAEEFYLDHCTQFKGAPFYWLFEGTKKAEFKALIYMQRYHTKNTFKNIAKAIEREQKQEQKVLQKIEKALPKADKNEQKALNKEKKHLEDRQSALNVYAEKIAKLAEDGVKIDRDAGVQQNIKPLSSVLEKITTR